MNQNTEKTAADIFNMTNDIKGIIFDMDGTLVNTTRIDYRAWEKLFSVHGKSLSFDDYIPMLGIKSEEVIREWLDLRDAELKKALEERFRYIKEVVDEEGISQIPYAADFVTRCRNEGYKIGLATSSRRIKMQLVIQKTGLTDLFDAIVTGDEVKHGKPMPDIFLETARKLSLTPEQCLVFEDAGNGVQAAKNAGMLCIGITTTHSAALLDKADLIIESFKNQNIPFFLEKLKKQKL